MINKDVREEARKEERKKKVNVIKNVKNLIRQYCTKTGCRGKQE